MKFRMLFAALAIFASAAAPTAALSQTPTLTPPTLEGTIKVYPKPSVDAGTSPTCVCTMQYDPVCARVGQAAWTTHSNACVAKCAGATEIRPGSC